MQGSEPVRTHARTNACWYIFLYLVAPFLSLLYPKRTSERPAGSSGSAGSALCCCASSSSRFCSCAVAEACRWSTLARWAETASMVCMILACTCKTHQG